MTREEFYSRLPQLLKRLFIFGVPAAILYILVWYLGGRNIYGHLLAALFSPISPLGNIDFSSGNATTAQLIYTVTMEGGMQADLTFPINQLNSSMIEVVTLVAFWPYRKSADFFKLAAWSLLFLVVYHFCLIHLQFYSIEIGPKLANDFNLFWEKSNWYIFIKNLSAFDKFIGRYWAGFPIFGIALLCNHLFTKKAEEKKTPSKKKTKGR